MIGELTEEQIEQVLTRNILGRLGCVNGSRSYVVPINYVYDGKYIVAHSMPGLKIDMMRLNPEVCFEVDEMKSFTHWTSVIAWGVYQELTSERDRYAAMKLFVDRMLHQKISKSAIPHLENSNEKGPPRESHIKPVIYRIVLNEKTGRFEND
jgi:nitroimidazol reductase NimA-like FMN-containing flavoprotein (pyridoxamine 5'-phosphate oxidase superfamily)